MIRDLAIAVGALVVATALAELLGAVNFGTALTFGVIGFMGAIVGSILLRGPRSTPAAPPEGPAARTRPRPSGRPRA